MHTKMFVGTPVGLLRCRRRRRRRLRRCLRRHRRRSSVDVSMPF